MGAEPAAFRGHTKRGPAAFAMIELFAQLVRLVEEADLFCCFCNDCDELQQALACLGTESEPALGGIGRGEPGNQEGL